MVGHAAGIVVELKKSAVCAPGIDRVTWAFDELSHYVDGAEALIGIMAPVGEMHEGDIAESLGGVEGPAWRCDRIEAT